MQESGYGEGAFYTPPRGGFGARPILEGGGYTEGPASDPRNRGPYRPGTGNNPLGVAPQPTGGRVGVRPGRGRGGLRGLIDRLRPGRGKGRAGGKGKGGGRKGRRGRSR